MQTVNYEVVVERVDDRSFDEAQVAAVAFLARYSGRTLDAYRQDLRGFFEPTDVLIPVGGEVDADLVVVGDRALTGWRRLLGSVLIATLGVRRLSGCRSAPTIATLSRRTLQARRAPVRAEVERVRDVR